MFISAVNIPSEQKTGLKRDLSQQQEGLFKEKENAEFLLLRERKRKQNQGWNIKVLPTHKHFFLFWLLSKRYYSVEPVIICDGK